MYARKCKMVLGEKHEQQVIIFQTRTIVHPSLNDISVKYVDDIPKFLQQKPSKKGITNISFMSYWI